MFDDNMDNIERILKQNEQKEENQKDEEKIFACAVGGPRPGSAHS